MNRSCTIIIDFMEELYAECHSKVALFVSWVVGRSDHPETYLTHSILFMYLEFHIPKKFNAKTQK